MKAPNGETARVIAALYIEERGPYASRAGVDPWPESRDARLYCGPHPVVAHPPCGPWSKLRHLCTRQDPSCGPRAVEQVQAFGGVLEHPEHSSLWDHCSLPRPGAAADRCGGQTYRVEQVDWGHKCVKPTWLYVVGVAPQWVAGRLSARRGSGVATHCVCTGPRQRIRLPVASKSAKRLTPPLFADLLCDLARRASPCTAHMGVA